jgi:hypothetical protein
MKDTEMRALIERLRAEKAIVERAIVAIERLGGCEEDPSEGPRRRGRKSMGAEERRKVGERMRRYWAKRKKGK